MFRTQSVLALVALCVGLAHSWSWDYVVTTDTSLEFYNSSTVTHEEDYGFFMKYLTYDAVQHRLLFIDGDNSYSIFLHCLDLATLEHTSFYMKPLHNDKDKVRSLAYDPVTELVFYSDSEAIYWYSLKPEFKNNFENGNRLIELNSGVFSAIAVDSCRGHIYWTYKNGTVSTMQRADLHGNDKVTLQEVSDPESFDNLVVDQQTQNLYFTNNYRDPRTGAPTVQFSIESRHLNREHRDTLYSERNQASSSTKALSVSKDNIYWMDQDNVIWKLQKNGNAKSEKEYTNDFMRTHYTVVANYNLEDQTRGVQDCAALISKYYVLNPSKTQSNNVPTNESLVCHNYCIHGDCSIIEGQAQCSCTAGYSGDRCEVDICREYCLNDGDCHLNKESEPVCQCKGDYRGERCAVSGLLAKCFQAVSMLKEILNSDLTPFAQDYGVKSTCTK